MRLTPPEKKGLFFAISPFVKGMAAELRLYGSRLDDTLKGGDLDLLLLVEHEEIADSLKMKKHYLLSAIKKQLGDRKIDVLIASRDTLLSDTFLNMIFPQSVILFTW